MRELPSRPAREALVLPEVPHQVQRIPQDEEHPRPEQQQHPARGDALLHLRRQLLPTPKRLDHDQQQEPAVQRGQRQDVHDGEVDVDHRRELVQPARVGTPHDLGAHAHDRDRPAHVILRLAEVGHEREEGLAHEAGEPPKLFTRQKQTLHRVARDSLTNLRVRLELHPDPPFAVHPRLGHHLYVHRRGVLTIDFEPDRVRTRGLNFSHDVVYRPARRGQRFAVDRGDDVAHLDAVLTRRGRAQQLRHFHPGAVRLLDEAHGVDLVV